MERRARKTRAADRPQDAAEAGGRPRLSRWRRRLAIAVAALGVAATVVAGMDIFAVQPRVDRFFGPVATGRQAGRPRVSTPARAAEPTKPPAPRPAPETLVVPVPGPVILAYGWTFSPTFAEWRFHSAVDLAGRAGQPVVAAAAGRVTAVRRSRLFGGVVGLDVGGGETCEYEGLARVDVRVGQQVHAGQQLGVVGPSPAAEASEPPHVHWQVLRDGKPVNPEDLRLTKAPTT